MRKRCQIAHHTFDIRFLHQSKWVSWFGGSAVFVVAHLTEVKGYIMVPLFDGIQICPGDPPRMALAAIVWKGSFKTHSYVKACPQIGINCRTRW